MFGIDDAIVEGLKLINKWVPDSTQAAAAENEWKLKVLELNAKADSDQRDIDKTEAAHPSIFVAGWRPYVGWLCGGVLTLKWFAYPLIGWFVLVSGHELPPLPDLTNNDSQNLLYALLGLGGLRTVDKMTGNDTQGVVTGFVSKAINKIKGK